jgi:hypothetical protein
VQRLFTAFPGGAPGAGLLLLRGATGISAIADAGWIAGSGGMSWIWAAGLASCGVLLLIGLVTPVAGASLAIVQGALVLGAPPLAGSLGRRETLLVAVALALAFIGPGWLSVDLQSLITSVDRRRGRTGITLAVSRSRCFSACPPGSSTQPSSHRR